MRLKFNPLWLQITDPNDRYWAFYKENGEAFDKIIWQACWSHASTVEPQDMHSMLILRMHRSNFLADFDPTKAKFGTYVTARINFYARHIVTHCVKKEKRFTQVFCAGINTVDEDEEVLELSSDSTIEEELSEVEVHEQAMKKMTPQQAQVLDLYSKGYKRNEIVKMLGLGSPQYVMHQQEGAKKILAETAVECQAVHIKRQKGKNGHAVSKKRPLSDRDKEVIEEMFLNVNGMIQEDTCLKMKAEVGRYISIFQVTGYVVRLHSLVAQGKLEVEDLDSYKEFIEAHRRKWATYKSPKYQGAVNV
jgi:hypothetical protein